MNRPRIRLPRDTIQPIWLEGVLSALLVGVLLWWVIQPAHALNGTPGVLSATGVTTTVGTTSAPCVPAGLATRYLLIEDVSASVDVWASPLGAAAVNGAGSIRLAANGGSLVFDNAQGIPTNAWQCIAASASTITVLAQ